VDRAFEALRTEFAAEENRTLKPYHVSCPRKRFSYEKVAEQLGVGVGAVKFDSSTPRQFAMILPAEILQTVSAPHEIDDELRRLRAFLRRGGTARP
jgi:hypothetical protein